MTLQPSSLADLQAMVSGADKLLPVGAQTKDRLTHLPENCQAISLDQLSGITEYEPSEYTFTAWAGTRLSTVQETLAAKGQYLPFAPPFVKAGATLGGTVAAGLSGAGRFRFGGVRDFLLGIRYVDGTGKVISGGGKVVKNAAGFDLPKLMVGSLGRYGILAELTFKVFPKPSHQLTVRVTCPTHTAAMERLMQSASARWELEALDYRASEKALYLRFAGPKEAIQKLATEALAQWANPSEILEPKQADTVWDRLREGCWPQAHQICLTKVPATPRQFLEWVEPMQEQAEIHLMAGGATAWLAHKQESNDAIAQLLSEHQLGGLVLRGQSDTLFLGHHPSKPIHDRLKQALDPNQRFPSF